MAVMSVTKHSVTCQKILADMSLSPKIMFISSDQEYQRLKEGMESLLASNEEKVRTFGLNTVATERYIVTEEQYVLPVTGQAYQRADCSAGSVQEDKGCHGSHAGWVPQTFCIFSPLFPSVSVDILCCHAPYFLFR